MARSRRRDERPVPAHPYRDTAVLYGIMALVLVGIAALTGGDVARAGLVSIVFFAVATTWTCLRFRSRIRERDEAAAAAGSSPGGSPSENGRGRSNDA